MLKYFLGVATGVAVVYGAQQLWALSLAGPDFRVWVTHTPIPPNSDPYDMLNVQSREDEPIVLKRVVMNDNPQCVNMELGTYKADTPVKLGEVYRFALGIHGLNACRPVRVVIETDRGEASYQFND